MSVYDRSIRGREGGAGEFQSRVNQATGSQIRDLRRYLSGGGVMSAPPSYVAGLGSSETLSASQRAAGVTARGPVSSNGSYANDSAATVMSTLSGLIKGSPSSGNKQVVWGVSLPTGNRRGRDRGFTQGPR